MIFTARTFAYIAGAIVAGAFFAYVANLRDVGDRVGVLHAQDAMLWLIGLGLVGIGVWPVARGRGLPDWRLSLWAAIGATILCGEIFNVRPVKELSCFVLLEARGHHRSQCYNP